MKYFLFAIFLIFTVACSPNYTVESSNDVYGAHMLNAFENYYTKAQFDSICDVDNINPDLQQWHILSLRDYETNENVSQYLYIKSLGANEIIYRVHPLDSNTYKITKRITK